MFCPLPRCAQFRVGQLRCLPKTAIRKVLSLFAVGGVVTLTGCAGVAGLGSSHPAVSPIRVTISPATATVTSGASLQFSAFVTGTSQTAVTWFSSAGRISPSGMLSAPKPGFTTSLRVIATSRADRRRRGSAVVEVAAIDAGPTISTTTLMAGTVGSAYSETLSATGGQAPYQWSVSSGTLPQGIRLNSDSGVLSGTPTVAGVFSFLAGLKDKAGNTLQRSLSLSVSAVSAASGPVQCDAPGYGCARTDTAVIPVGKLPNWGGLKGAGTIFTDPSFNSSHPPQYVRVTDANSGEDHVSFTVGDGSGDDSHFNVDDTLLWLTTTGNAIFAFGFNPTTMQVGLVSKLPPGKYCCNGQWSQTNRNWLYTITGDGKLWKLDFSGRSISSPGSPTASQVYDFGENCGANGRSVLDFAGVGAGDAVFNATFGAQDDASATRVVSYNSSTGKCYLYNTHAGTVTQYPGGTVLGSVTTRDRFFIHNAHGDGAGAWMIVIKSTLSCPTCAATVYAWKIGTTTVSTCSGSCGGHWTETASGWFNNDGPTGNYPPLLFRTWDNFSTANSTEMNTGSTPFNYTLDTHPTTKNDPLGNNSYPVFASTYDTSGTSSPYANEIIAWQQPSGPILRFGHTFNSAQEPDATQFQAEIAVGAVSSTGHFYAFTTDGEGTLGNTDGVHPRCTISAGTCRSDVFILNLVPPPAN